MSATSHALRIAILMAAAGLALGVKLANTSAMDRDGSRYIGQARLWGAGEWRRALSGSVDHPIYPLAIAAVRRLGFADDPVSWQRAAQIASVGSGILLLIPLYLAGWELYGERSAWIGTLLLIMAPAATDTFADALSESTFLHLWTWGLWAALRFARDGSIGWLIGAAAGGGLAYLTRPEGLLLPMALVGMLAIVPCVRGLRLPRRRWLAAMGILVVGPLALIVPYIIAKGGIGSKPSIARLLGKAPSAAPNAIERKRPMDPNQSTAKTIGIAVKEVVTALRELVGWPLAATIVAGLAIARPRLGQGRGWLLTALIVIASALALIRLHATAGYCAPRHTIVPASLLLLASGDALRRIWDGIKERVARPWGRLALGTSAMTALAVPALIGLSAPLNAQNQGYREAGQWLSQHAKAEERVLDLTALALFYGDQTGYWFGNYFDARNDPRLRWVAVRDAHLRGPWDYCAHLRRIVGDRKPRETFPARPKPGQSVVMVFDLRG